jgi:CBS domain-containing protein
MVEHRVADVMTTPMLTLDPDTSVERAAEGMLEAGIKSLVVVEEGCRPAGIFTSTDALAVLADGASGADVTVEEYMTSPVETVGPDEPLSVVAERMADGEFSHLPVTDADGDGVGILTTTDLAGALSANGAEPLARRETAADEATSGRE